MHAQGCISTGGRHIVTLILFDFQFSAFSAAENCSVAFHHGLSGTQVAGAEATMETAAGIGCHGRRRAECPSGATQSR
jgi:hypothetical protein